MRLIICVIIFMYCWIDNDNLVAADRELDRCMKIIRYAKNIAARKKAIDAITHGGSDDDRMPALLLASRYTKIKEYALDALEIRTGVKVGEQGGPSNRTSGDWFAWWDAQQALKLSNSEKLDVEENRQFDLKKYARILKGNDHVKKRAAIVKITHGGKDVDRMPLLVSAARDRQVSSYALKALQQRTGLRPNPVRGERDGPGFPGFPETNDATGWETWWKKKEGSGRLKKESRKRNITTEPDQEPERLKVLAVDPKPDTMVSLGKMDRVTFKNGGLIMCYVLVKNTDSTGQLVSIEIVHKNKTDKEKISAHLIDEIYHDVR